MEPKAQKVSGSRAAGGGADGFVFALRRESRRGDGPIIGQTYYFDLSAKYDDLCCIGASDPGSINSAYLPDATLHYVPFTYAGAVTAYALPEDICTISTDENVASYVASRVLFIADYRLSRKVAWSDLNDNGLIYGVSYTSGGACYKLRAPSGGSVYSGSSVVPANNEWDMLGQSGLIKNAASSIVQDYTTGTVEVGMRVFRGESDSISRFGDIYSNNSLTLIGYRPVLQVEDADSASLEVVTLRLNGSSLNSSTADLKLIVKAGASFTAPASQGLTFPSGESDLPWRGTDGKLYNVGDTVPSSVTTLTAEYGYAIINHLTNIETSNPTSHRTKTNGEDYTTTLSALDGYGLPDTLDVSVDGIPLTAGSDTYTYDKTSGRLTIQSAAINGSVSITASGVDNRGPTLTGYATRTSDLTAMVVISSNEVGTYHYSLVEHGAPAPTIDTSATDTLCGLYERTFFLYDLGNADVKDLYVVAKDASGNVGPALLLNIAVHSPQEYAMLATPATLDFGTRDVGYGTRTGATGIPAAQTVTVKNIGNQSIDVSLPKLPHFLITAGDGFSGAGATLSAGQEAQFTIQPKDTMPIYTDALTMSIGYKPDAGDLWYTDVPVSFVIKPTPEKLSLPVGETYYFDLSGVDSLSTAGGTVNTNLPDQTLHYVPFTYAGTVKAYSLASGETSGSNADATNRSLFIADHGVKTAISWDTLYMQNLINGVSFTSGSATYTMRAPSGGGKVHDTSELAPNRCAYPYMNEWDAILDKCNQGVSASGTQLIKNWNSNLSWVQDNKNGYAALRGAGMTPREFTTNVTYNNRTTYSFRPVLEVPSTLSGNDLRAVTIKLNRVKLGGSGDDLKLAVKTGEAFQAPASAGLTPPDGVAGQTLLWQAENGVLYAPSASVPATVTRLTAEYGYTIINSLTHLTTSNSQTGFIPIEGGDYSATLSPINGYLLPNTVTVTVGASTLSSGASTYTYDNATGCLTIKAAAITDDVTITAEGRTQSAAPIIDTPTVAKTAAIQPSVAFTLTNTPAYDDSQTWTVYDAATGAALAEGVTASNIGNTLTLSHATDLPADAYYVAVTEGSKAESPRLALTVAPYQAPSVSLGSDTTVSVAFAYADTGVKEDTIDIITNTGTDSSVTFPATDFTLSDSATVFAAVPGVSVTGAAGGKLTISMEKDALATSAYLWYGGASVGEITLQKTVQGRTAAPAFISDSYTLTSLTDTAAIFTLIAAPADGTAFTVYASADGTATAGTAALTNETTLTVTLSATPASTAVYHISALCAPDAESARTPVTVNPYVQSADTALSTLSYTVDGGTPVSLATAQIDTSAQAGGLSVVLPFGTSPTAVISLSGTPADSKASVTANDGVALVSGIGTAVITVTAENGAVQTYRIHFTIQAQSAAPLASVMTVAKTAAIQPSVAFTLTNAPAYADSQTWTVYDAATGAALAEGVTASNIGNTLTLSHATDLPADAYYVAVTEGSKAESPRLALTVAPYQAPSVSLGSDTTVSVAFAYADTGAKEDTIDIITSTGTDSSVTFPATDFTLSDSATVFAAVPGVSVTGAAGGKLTISMEKDALTTSAYLWYGGASVGEITLQKTVQGRTAAPAFISDSYTLTSLTDTAAIFTLTAAPADGTAFTVYASADGTATAGTAVLTNETTLTVTLSATPASTAVYHISALCAPDAESARTPVTVNPYVQSADTTLSTLSYTVGGGTPVSLTTAQIDTSAQAGGLSVALPFGTSPTASIQLAGIARDANATISGGAGRLAGGSGSITFTVTAQDGVTTQNYRINFTIQGKTAAPTFLSTDDALTAANDVTVAFTLTNAMSGGTYRVYAAPAGGSAIPSMISVSGSTVTLTLDAPLTATTKYYISAQSDNKVESDRTEVTVHPYAAPVITFTTQPLSITVTQGNITESLTAAASVSSSGTVALNWFACDADGHMTGDSLGIAGTFPLPTMLTAGTYYYRCVARYADALTVNSNVARVSVLACAPLQVVLSPSSTIVQGMSGELIVTIRSNASGFDINNFDAAKGVQMRFENGAFMKLTQGTQCDITTGSIKVTLHSAYLNTLAVGSYTLRVHLTGAGYPSYVETTLTVARYVDPPQTGDKAAPWMWLALCLFSGALLISGLRKQRRA